MSSRSNISIATLFFLMFFNLSSANAQTSSAGGATTAEPAEKYHCTEKCPKNADEANGFTWNNFDCNCKKDKATATCVASGVCHEYKAGVPIYEPVATQPAGGTPVHKKKKKSIACTCSKTTSPPVVKNSLSDVEAVDQESSTDSELCSVAID